MFKYFSAIILFLYLSFCEPGSVLANYTFNDPFDTDLSTSWITITGHIQPDLLSGLGRTYAKFRQGSSNSYSYLGNESIENNVISVKFDFYYPNFTTTQGAGFMLTNKVPKISQNPPNDNGDYSVGIWPISGNFYLLSPLCDKTGLCSLTVNNRAIFKISGSTWNTIAIDYLVDRVRITLNDSSLELPYGTHPLPNGFFFGNPVLATNSQSWMDFHIDNFSIEYGDPTIIPTFPYLSQNNPLWGSKEYDSANEWAGIDKSGIDRWGCALTSVAMILQKNGVKTIDSNADVNPDNLNTWLKRQPDGYIGSGLINWLAITRYAKESFAVGHSPTKLEYIRSYLPTTPILPAILGLPGHFVLAYGEDLLNWNIHDPDDEMKTSLPKTSSIKSINRFIPSNTDLSYFLFTSNVPLNTVLTDTNGHTIPMTWIAENIVDDIGGSPGPILYTAMIPKPNTGAYILDIAENNLQQANFELLLYDKEGRVKTDNFEIKLGDSQYKIDYNSDLVENCKTSEIDITAPDAPSLVSPQNGGLVNSTNLALNWDSVSDISEPIEYEYKYADTAGFTTNTSIDISNGADGIYNWSVRACDALSNCSPWTIEWSFEIDSTAPTYVGTNDFEGWHQTPQLALFQYVDMHLNADYDPPSCQIKTEGSNRQCIVYPSLCDIVGNCNTDSQISKSANIDLSAPISTIDIPTEIVNWDGKIKGTAIDNLSGVKKVELKITMPDNTVMNVTTSGTDNWEYTLTKPTAGKYTIESIATDLAGNIQAQEMKMTITNTNPVAKLLNPPKIVIADDFGHLIGATWSGVGSAKKYFIYLGKSPNDLSKIYETKYNGWISHKLENGRYYLGITALDKDGNESHMSRIVIVEIKRRLFWWR